MNENLIKDEKTTKELKIKIGTSNSTDLYFSNSIPNHFILENKTTKHKEKIFFPHFDGKVSTLLSENSFNFKKETIQKAIETLEDPSFKFNLENLKVLDFYGFSFHKPLFKTFFADTSLISLIFNNLLFKEYIELENPSNTHNKFIWDFENWLVPHSSNENAKTFLKSVFVSHFIFSNFLRQLKPQEQFNIFIPHPNSPIDELVIPPIALFNKTTNTDPMVKLLKPDDQPDPIYYSHLKIDDYSQQAFTHSFKNIYNSVNLNDVLKNINDFLKTNFQSHFFTNTDPSHILNKTTQNFTKTLRKNPSFLQELKSQKISPSSNTSFHSEQFPQLPNHPFFQQLLQKEYNIDFDSKINNLLPLLEPTLSSKWFKNIINENLYSDLLLKQVLSEINIFLNEIETNPNSSNEISFYNWKLDLNYINKNLMKSFTDPQLQDEIQDLLNKMLIISLSFKMNNLSFKLPKKLNEIIDYQLPLEQELAFFNAWNSESFNSQINLASSLNQKIFLTPIQQKEFEQDNSLTTSHTKLKKEVETLLQKQKQTKNILVSDEQLITSTLTSKLFNLGHSLKDIIKTFSDIINAQLPFLKSKIHFLKLSDKEIQNQNLKMTNFITETKLNFKQNFEQISENLEFLFVYSLLSRVKTTDDNLKQRIQSAISENNISTGNDFEFFDFSLFKKIIQSLNDLRRQDRPTTIDNFSSLPKITIIDNGTPSQYFPLNSLPMAFLIPYLFNNCAGNRIYSAFQKIISEQPTQSIPETFWYLGYDFANNKITTLTEIAQRQNHRTNTTNYVVSEELTLFNKKFSDPACFKSLFSNWELNQPTIDQLEKSFWSSKSKNLFIVKINNKVHALDEKVYSDFKQQFPDFLKQKKLTSQQILFLTKQIEIQKELINNQLTFPTLKPKKSI